MGSVPTHKRHSGPGHLEQGRPANALTSVRDLQPCGLIPHRRFRLYPTSHAFVKHFAMDQGRALLQGVEPELLQPDELLGGLPGRRPLPMSSPVKGTPKGGAQQPAHGAQNADTTSWFSSLFKMNGERGGDAGGQAQGSLHSPPQVCSAVQCRPLHQVMAASQSRSGQCRRLYACLAAVWSSRCPGDRVWHEACLPLLWSRMECTGGMKGVATQLGRCAGCMMGQQYLQELIRVHSQRAGSSRQCHMAGDIQQRSHLHCLCTLIQTQLSEVLSACPGRSGCLPADRAIQEHDKQPQLIAQPAAAHQTAKNHSSSAKPLQDAQPVAG